MKYRLFTVLAAAALLNAATTISNVLVDSLVREADGRWTGRVTYDISTASTNLFVWLEFSSDGGATWEQRDIQAVGGVGGLSAGGAGLRARWCVDGDKGPACKIRVRVNDTAATYSNFDADSNKYPFPVPVDPYANIERLVSRTDFPNFADPANQLPQLDFFKSTTSGAVRAGFVRLSHFRDANLFMHCMYLTDGIEQYVFLSGDCVRMYNSYLHAVRDTLNRHFGIPEDNIMITWNHRHYTDGSDSLNRIIALVEAARAAAVPVKVAYFDHDFGRLYYAQTYMGSTPTYGEKMGHFCENNVVYPHVALHWQTDAAGDTVGALVEDTRPEMLQHFLDAPTDGFVQGLVFKDMSDQLKAVMLKSTGHFDTGLPRCVYDTLKARLGSGAEIMYINGFGGNMCLLHHESCGSAQTSQPGWNTFGPAATAARFADFVEEQLPSLQFAPLTGVGAVMGWDLFGSTYHQRDSLLALDPARQGTGVGVFRLNDIYISTLPSEGNAEVGLYLRARTAGLKHMYTGYGNTWAGNYWSWGRWQNVSCYTCPVVYPRYQCFRLAQEVVRGVNLLHDSW